jgi:diaminohydroxyphosphoribosylaminopyrimidine deaminase/5-amino-6-(5-phosphoribosylamino)uracil reductase
MVLSRQKENQKNRSGLPINIQDNNQMAYEEQAILVGTQTVIDDNQKLNARDWYKQPLESF